MYVRKLSRYIFIYKILQTYCIVFRFYVFILFYCKKNVTTDKFVLLQQMLLLINLVSSTVSNRREKSWGKRIGDVGAAGKVGVGRGVKGYPSDLEKKGGRGRDKRKRRDREQRVLIDAAVLILGNSFYFIRFFSLAHPSREDLEHRYYHDVQLVR